MAINKNYIPGILFGLLAIGVGIFILVKRPIYDDPKKDYTKTNIITGSIAIAFGAIFVGVYTGLIIASIRGNTIEYEGIIN